MDQASKEVTSSVVDSVGPPWTEQKFISQKIISIWVSLNCWGFTELLFFFFAKEGEGEARRREEGRE
jgi:hypothetical protein